MTCIICHGENIEVRDVAEEIRVGTDIVHVQIQIPVCQTCGERYYDRQTMRYLEQVERQLNEGKGTFKEIGRVLAYG